MPTTPILEEIKAAAAEYERLKATAGAAKDARDRLIREAAKQHVPQVAVVAASGLTRERIRVIVDPTKRPARPRATGRIPQ